MVVGVSVVVVVGRVGVVVVDAVRFGFVVVVGVVVVVVGGVVGVVAGVVAGAVAVFAVAVLAAAVDVLPLLQSLSLLPLSPLSAGVTVDVAGVRM